jgi:hypothetical protein
MKSVGGQMQARIPVADSGVGTRKSSLNPSTSYDRRVPPGQSLRDKNALSRDRVAPEVGFEPRSRYM